VSGLYRTVYVDLCIVEVQLKQELFQNKAYQELKGS